jgi:hypothetical protein
MLDEQTEKIAQEAIDEGRVVLPGIQALFGFQLIAVLMSVSDSCRKASS